MEQVLRINGAELRTRASGMGPNLVLIHGFPVHSGTWDALLPTLESRFRCWRVDLPGLWGGDWHPQADFHFSAQAQRIAIALRHLGVHQYHLMAHDTGATLARLLAAAHIGAAQRLVLFNTELPGHRPPWVGVYQRLAVLPGAALGFALCLRSAAYRRSGLGFGGLYPNPREADAAFYARYLKPMLEDRRRLHGMLRYLRGIDWQVVDGLADPVTAHGRETLMIWGADDPTFPLTDAQRTADLQPRTRLLSVPGQRLMVHEALPPAVRDEMLAFLCAPPVRPKSEQNRAAQAQKDEEAHHVGHGGENHAAGQRRVDAEAL